MTTRRARSPMPSAFSAAIPNARPISARRWSQANQGIVTADARAAFERARAADPGAVRPRFYLALALGQEGKTDEAIAAWQELLAGAPPGAPWVEVGTRTARQAQWRAGARRDIRRSAARAELGRRRRGGKPAPGRPSRHDQRHGRAACGTAEDRPRRSGGVGAAGPLLYGPRPRPRMPRRRWPRPGQSSRRRSARRSTRSPSNSA